MAICRSKRLSACEKSGIAAGLFPLAIPPFPQKLGHAACGSVAGRVNSPDHFTPALGIVRMCDFVPLSSEIATAARRVVYREILQAFSASVVAYDDGKGVNRRTPGWIAHQSETGAPSHRRQSPAPAPSTPPNGVGICTHSAFAPRAAPILESPYRNHIGARDIAGSEEYPPARSSASQPPGLLRCPYF